MDNKHNFFLFIRAFRLQKDKLVTLKSKKLKRQHYEVDFLFVFACRFNFQTEPIYLPIGYYY